jgi:hypothetical protein
MAYKKQLKDKNGNVIYPDVGLNLDAVVYSDDPTVVEPEPTAYIGTDEIEDGAVTPSKISSATYSTSEQVVGTWIDGKPIYRKVIAGDATGTSFSVGIGDNDIDSIIKLDAYRKVAGTPMDIVGGFYTSATDYFKYWYRKTTADVCQIEFRSSLGTYAYTAIIEYTKTTD